MTMQLSYHGILFLMLLQVMTPVKDNIINASDSLSQSKIYKLSSNEHNFTYDQIEANSIGIACQDTINVTLDIACTKTITVDELLEGNLEAFTADDFFINIFDEDISNGSQVDGVGTHIYRIALKEEALHNSDEGLLSDENWMTEGQVETVNSITTINGPYHFLSLPMVGTIQFDWNTGNSAYLIEVIDLDGNTLKEETANSSSSSTFQADISEEALLTITKVGTDPGALALSNIAYEFTWTEDILNASICGGYINAEDKTAPVIECTETVETIEIERKVQLFSETSDEATDLNYNECEFFSNILINDNYYIGTRSIEVEETAWYTFEIESNGDAVEGLLYQSSFDSENACDHLTATTQAIASGLGYFSGGDSKHMIVFLNKGLSYVLVQRSAVNQTYNWTVYQENDYAVKDLTQTDASVIYPLVCGDEDYILDNEESLDWTVSPTLGEDCSETYTRFVDYFQAGEQCEADEIIRRIEQVDAYSNIGSCEQSWKIEKIEVGDIVLPPLNVKLNCDDSYELDENGNPAPTETGQPAFYSAFGVSNFSDAYCNIRAIYKDQRFNTDCNATFKIYREWTIWDWCDEENSRVYTQLITVGDFEAPDFDLPAVRLLGQNEDLDTLIISATAFDCTKSFAIPQPENIKDNCGTSSSVKAILKETSGEQVLALEGGNQPIYFENIKVGTYLLEYQVSDECGNSRSKEMVFILRDGIDPIAICNNSINITVGGNGIGVLESMDVDEGSSDNCSEELIYQIRRQIDPACVEEFKSETGQEVTFDEQAQEYYTQWSDRTFFTCCDIDKTIKIFLKVIDESGNYNICWQEVTIEDKRAPEITPPDNQIVDCLEFAEVSPLDIRQLQSLFGIPTVTDDYCNAEWKELTPIFEDQSCNLGRLTRSFVAFDAAGNYSDTVYQVIDVEALVNYEIRFPADVNNYTCDVELTDTLQTSVLGCDVLAINQDTTLFLPDDGSCYEWRINYQIINWCEFDGNPKPTGISRNEDKDNEIGEDAVFVLVRPDGTAYVDDNNNENDGFFRSLTSNGFWEYTQVINLLDTIAPEILSNEPDPVCIYDETCEGLIDYSIVLFDFCDLSTIQMEVEVDLDSDGEYVPFDGEILGRAPKYRIRGSYREGKHRFLLRITDGCGNTVINQLPFEVVDCEPPAPICVEQLSIELGQVYPPRDVNNDGVIDRGANEIWVSDFLPQVRKPDCNPEIRFSINKAEDPPHPDSTAITITCEDAPFVAVHIYAWDNANNPYSVQPDGTLGGPNYDFCTTFINVQDNRFSLCDTLFSLNRISGFIETAEGLPVQNVEVQLSGNNPVSSNSDDQGFYSFQNIQLGYDYTVTPKLDVNPLDGVSTFDLLLMRKHILGEEQLTSPYQYIAADINRSGTISSIDMILLRKFILNITDVSEMDNNWRFITSNHKFSNNSDQWLTAIPEWIGLNNFEPDGLDYYNFTAVKVGDVNNSNQYAGLVAEPRSANDLTMFYEQKLTNEGNIKVTIGSESWKEIEAIQATLSFDPSQYDLFELERSSLISDTDISLSELHNGLILISSLLEGRKEEELISLVFTPRNNMLSDNIISLSNRILTSEAYGVDSKVKGLNLSNRIIGDAGIRDLQVSPNPFSDHTLVNFYSAQTGNAFLRVYDAKGQEILFERFSLEQGINQLRIDKDQLSSANGLFFVTISDKQSLLQTKILLTK